MINLANTEEEKREEATPKAHVPDYPYGLKLTLTPEMIAKLGIMRAPAIGEKINLSAICEVCGVNKSSEESEKYSIELQITDMELKKSKEYNIDETRQVLYGE